MTPDTRSSDISAPAVRMMPRGATWPANGQRQLWRILEALLRHERLTVLTTIERYQCYALSQRIGELKALGWPIKRTMVKVASGKTVAEYAI